MRCVTCLQADCFSETLVQSWIQDPREGLLLLNPSFKGMGCVSTLQGGLFPAAVLFTSSQGQGWLSCSQQKPRMLEQGSFIALCTQVPVAHGAVPGFLPKGALGLPLTASPN